MLKGKSLSKRQRSERLAACAFTAPAMALLIAFLVIPMYYTVYYSLFKYHIIRPDDMRFAGLENYAKLFHDGNFWKALKNTAYFTVIVVPLQCALALALALLVSKRFKGVAIFRTMYFGPQLTSMVVISVLWAVLYNSNPNTGLINSVLVGLGMEPINFLTNERTAMNSIIFMSAWQGAGYQMMIFLAGLQSIPGSLYEASSIDGATPMRTFFTIVMPISKTVYATVFILDFVAHWNDFMWPFLVMTGKETRTIQLAVQSFFSTSPVHYSAIMAALVVSAIPMIIMFVFMQKYYVEGIASSGIKG